nr:glycosyltransferase [uncultured Pseudodesulfovibrio sp.]
MNYTTEHIEACICTYNEEQNITACIQSIRTAGISRIHVVDAGSEDLTVSLAKHAGAGVTISAKGLASQRQVGLEACRMPFLLYVDADDRLDPSCPLELLEELKTHHADAIQASLRVENPQSYWQRGMDSLLHYCISTPGPTTMVGRPALYRTDSLLRVGLDRSFDGVGNEDAALSIRMEAAGMRQRIGTALCYRHHPRTFMNNARAWIKYGKGDARLIQNYPKKAKAVLWHILVRYPVLRSCDMIKQGDFVLIGFPICAGLIRLIGMIVGFLNNFGTQTASNPQDSKSEQRK